MCSTWKKLSSDSSLERTVIRWAAGRIMWVNFPIASWCVFISDWVRDVCIVLYIVMMAAWVVMCVRSGSESRCRFAQWS